MVNTQTEYARCLRIRYDDVACININFALSKTRGSFAKEERKGGQKKKVETVQRKRIRAKVSRGVWCRQLLNFDSGDLFGPCCLVTKGANAA